MCNPTIIPTASGSLTMSDPGPAAFDKMFNEVTQNIEQQEKSRRELELKERKEQLSQTKKKDTCCSTLCNTF